jgi:hypothetical protein
VTQNNHGHISVNPAIADMGSKALVIVLITFADPDCFNGLKLFE